MPSTMPPPIQRLGLSIADLHLATGVSVALLEGYQRGVFKPGGAESRALRGFSNYLYELTPITLARYLDKIRFRLLCSCLPEKEIHSLLTLPDHASYHRRLLEFSEIYSDELESIIRARARKNGYVPSDHE